MDTRFHCVYLLASLDPACPGAYYVGYSVHPLRRLRQHNGELVNGARQTKRRGRPWQLICCVSGFGEDRIALKFEWCWQHPAAAAMLKPHVHLLQGLARGIHYAVGVLHLLLHTELFARRRLKLHVFDAERMDRYRAAVSAVQVRSGTPYLVLHASVEVELVDSQDAFEREHLRGGAGADLTDGRAEEETLVRRCAELVARAAATPHHPPAFVPPRRFHSYTVDDFVRLRAREHEQLSQGLLPCSLCTLPLRAPYILRCPHHPFCPVQTHLVCLAIWFHHTGRGAQTAVGAGGSSGSLLPAGGAAARDPPPLTPLSQRTPAVAATPRLRGRNGACVSPVRRTMWGGGSRRWLAARSRHRSPATTTGATTIAEATPVPDALVGHVSGGEDDPTTATTGGEATAAVRPLDAMTPGVMVGSAQPVHLIPATSVPCPVCGVMLEWAELVRSLKAHVIRERHAREVRRRAACEEAWARRLARVNRADPGKPSGATRAERPPSGSPRHGGERKRSRVVAAPPPPPSGDALAPTLGDGGGGVSAMMAALAWTEFREEEWLDL